MFTYAELIGGKHFDLKVNPAAPTKNPADYKIVGKPIERLDIPGKLTGEFTYIQDFRVSGMGRALHRLGPLSLRAFAKCALRGAKGVNNSLQKSVAAEKRIIFTLV
jgi:hypothetical protein